MDSSSYKGIHVTSLQNVKIEARIDFPARNPAIAEIEPTTSNPQLASIRQWADGPTPHTTQLRIGSESVRLDQDRHHSVSLALTRNDQGATTAHQTKVR
jgi:hypothetical protein